MSLRVKEIFDILMIELFDRNSSANVFTIFEKKMGFVKFDNDILSNYCDISISCVVRYIQQLSVLMSLAGIDREYIREFCTNCEKDFNNSIVNWQDLESCDIKKYLMGIWYTLGQQFMLAVNIFYNSYALGIFNSKKIYSVDQCVLDFVPYFFNYVASEYVLDVHVNVSYVRNEARFVQLRKDSNIYHHFNLYENSLSLSYSSVPEYSIFINYPGDKIRGEGITMLYDNWCGVKYTSTYKKVDVLVSAKKNICVLNPSFKLRRNIDSVVIHVSPVSNNCQSAQRVDDDEQRVLSFVGTKYEIKDRCLNLNTYLKSENVNNGSIRVGAIDKEYCVVPSEMRNFLNYNIDTYSRYLYTLCKCGSLYSKLIKYDYYNGNIVASIISYLEFQRQCAGACVKFKDSKLCCSSAPPDYIDLDVIDRRGVRFYLNGIVYVKEWDKRLFVTKADLYLLFTKIMGLQFHKHCTKRGKKEYCDAFFRKFERRWVTEIKKNG